MIRFSITKLMVFVLFICELSINSYAQLVIDNTMTPQQLVQNVLLGSGVTVSNIQFTGSSLSIGKFTGSSTNLNIPYGIILSTGNINDAVGPNNSDFAGVNLYQPGNAQLTSIAGYDTYDAAILEFDFVPASDTIKFNYVFGSEEYPEYVCSDYNDVFAFFLTGPNPLGGTYNNKNIALIPNTNTPVAINSINGGAPGPGYSASQCLSLSHSNYYVNNVGGTTIQYDGFTKVLQAVAHVVACETYHIKLAIADAGDGIYDSGVFLEAKSFSSPTVTISAIATTNDSIMIEGCGAATFIFTRDNAASVQPFTIHYMIGGTAVNGIDYQDLAGNPIPDSVYFLPGQDSAFLVINPVFDDISETDETIIISVPQILSCSHDTVRAIIYIQNVDKMKVQIQGKTLICSQPPFSEVANLTSMLIGGYGPFYYKWNTDIDTTAISNLPNLDVSPLQPTTYILTVIDTCGNASVSNSVTVNIECPIEIYNVFTPNGDGINDKFVIKNLEYFPGSTLTVYNRWGRKVYESTDYKNDWDGGNCSDGVYYFILNQAKFNKPFNGIVTIIR